MREKRSILFITAALILTACMMPLISNAEEEAPIRAPTLKKGHITSDENWMENISGYALENVVIDEGVTVTVGPGVPLWFYSNSFFYVEGELIVKGLSGDIVEFKCLTPGSDWGRFYVNTSGRADIQNFSIRDRSYVGLGVRGEKCVFKNGEVHGGFQNIYLESHGGHLLENLELYDPTNYGISLYANDKMTTARSIRVTDAGAGAIATGSPNGTFEGIYCYNATYYGLYSNYGSENIVIRDFLITSPEFKESLDAIRVLDRSHHVLFENGVIENCSRGIYMGTALTGSDVMFRDVTVKDSVNRSIECGAGGNLHATLVNCRLGGNEQTISMNASGASQEVHFINTTWDSGSPIEVLEGAYLNISWFLDVEVTDGLMDPLNTNLKVFPSGGGMPDNIDMPDGRLDKYEVMERTMRGGYRTVYYSKDYEFRAVDHPTSSHLIEDETISGYTKWEILLDLQPTNDMPGMIETEEDVWYETDLYDHFTDPEGLPMEFEVLESPELNVVQPGGATSGTMRVKNREANWFGTGWVHITATDTGMNLTEKNVTVNIEPVNDAPGFTQEIAELTCQEDSWTYFNFTGMVEDPEDDDIILIFPDNPDYITEYNATLMNLTIHPAEDYFGMLEVEVNLSDGEDWSHEMLLVNVTPVNDPPEVTVMVGNETADMVQYPINETSSVTAHEIALEEDTEVDLWLDASDVDSENLTYSFQEEDLVHGSIEVETYQKEVVVNETTNETEIQNVTVWSNFTYTPLPNDAEGDLVRFIVSDEVAQTETWVWFNVTPVNDAIEFGAPDDWNLTVVLNEMQTIDIGDWITDADGDTPQITTSSEYINVNGTELQLLYNDTFTGISEVVTVTVSDGVTEDTATLLVNINAPGDDDDDDEPALELPDVKGKGDGWTVEIEGSEGQDLWVIVEDEEGNRTSYKMDYEDGRYTGDIPLEEAGEGLNYWISGEEGGEPLGDDYQGTLPSPRKEEEDDDFPVWIIILIVVIVLLLIIILVLMATGKKEEYYHEE
ncbi:MAG: right-handed parallel beta-helix repeat-containing protein [Thermoplasmatota archaeon]